MEENVFSILYRYIEEEREAIRESVMCGRPQDYVAYARAIERNKAFEEMGQEIKDLEKRVMDQ